MKEFLVGLGSLLFLLFVIHIGFRGLCDANIDMLNKFNELNSEIDANIESALDKNYPGYTNYYNTGNKNSFVYDGKKYNFDYDYDTNTLTVFDSTGTVIDGTYINGQRQNTETEIESTEIVSETTSESEAADTSVDTDKADSTPVSESNSDLNRRIQSTILEKYMDATITSYDASNLSGTFDTDEGSYKFFYSDDLLEITEVGNPNNVIYMKVQK